MQKFKLVVEVTVNTLEDVDKVCVMEEIQDLLDGFDSGVATVVED